MKFRLGEQAVYEPGYDSNYAGQTVTILETIDSARYRVRWKDGVTTNEYAATLHRMSPKVYVVGNELRLEAE